MLPSDSGILAEPRGIAFTSLQQRQSISLSLCNVRISEAVVRSCSVKKRYLRAATL